VIRHQNDVLLGGGAVPDARDSEWWKVLTEIEDLRHDGAHDWAEATLAGIHDTIERTHRVSQAQRRAITKIKSSEWAPSRAFDQWGRGRRWH